LRVLNGVCIGYNCCSFLLPRISLPKNANFTSWFFVACFNIVFLKNDVAFVAILLLVFFEGGREVLFYQASFLKIYNLNFHRFFVDFYEIFLEFF
jgi:hypothetical protein